MDKQVSLSGLSDELAQVRTKKKEFLSQIERIVPWGEWLTLIRPCYYKGERGNKPYDLERMLRIYLLQNLYDLADEATVAEVIDSRAFSEFCGVDSSNQVPDGDTLGRFRNLLIRNGLQEKLFRQVVELFFSSPSESNASWSASQRIGTMDTKTLWFAARLKIRRMQTESCLCFKHSQSSTNASRHSR